MTNFFILKYQQNFTIIHINLPKFNSYHQSDWLKDARSRKVAINGPTLIKAIINLLLLKKEFKKNLNIF
ncbi:hypothetical protein BpHYR1_023209 [Brachionus plicatilis]|uniref:Uncharacterized protein n=1 Tax=Brachionus plicatilis TaxID=10195 RepID=A0A3M7PUY6_BRAPC|nr:hypothetical protein BpHYR1_023209 [Brachionus plicatilis]